MQTISILKSIKWKFTAKPLNLKWCHEIPWKIIIFLITTHGNELFKDYVTVTRASYNCSESIDLREIPKKISQSRIAPFVFNQWSIRLWMVHLSQYQKKVSFDLNLLYYFFLFLKINSCIFKLETVCLSSNCLVF